MLDMYQAITIQKLNTVADLMYTSPWIAFWTGGMTLGMPVPQLSSVFRRNILDARDFLTESDKSHAFTGTDIESTGEIGNADPIQNSQAEAQVKSRNLLRDKIEQNLTIDKKRWRIWTVYLLMSVCGFVMAVLWAFLSVGTLYIDSPRITWACEDGNTETKSATVFSFWMVIAWYISSITLLYWNSSCGKPQMVFHLRRLGDVRQPAVIGPAAVSPYVRPGTIASIWKAVRITWRVNTFNLW